MTHRPRILVLGIGNILWADEGFGVRAVEAFHARYARAGQRHRARRRHAGALPRAICARPTILLVFDAIDYGLDARNAEARARRRSAEIHRREEDEPASDRLSGSAERRRSARPIIPTRLALIGCQPLDLEDWGGPLTEPVRDAIDAAVMAAHDILLEWGVDCVPRAEPLPPGLALLKHDLDHQSYENRRGAGAAGEWRD